MKAQNSYMNCMENGSIDADKFRAMVSERAYFKAEKRGFACGHELDDWLEAEQEVINQCYYWLLDTDLP